MMERLTTNKDVSEMGMFELAHNGCYCKNGVARYRDFENDIDARKLTRQLLKDYADGDDAFVDDDDFDEEMIELLMYGTSTMEGMIALFYRNMWAMADLRERLKEYEDAEEQGILLRLPCKVGDTVYFIYRNEVHHEEVKRFFQCNGGKNWGIVLWGMYPDLYFDQIGKTVFLTKAEAEQKFKEMESEQDGNT